MTDGASPAPAAPPKALVMSACLPPMAGGSAKMMRNLLGPFPPGSLVFLRGDNPMFRLGQEDELGPADVADLPKLLRSFRLGLPSWLEYLWVSAIARRAAALARREKVVSIFANYPFGYYLVAAWLAARRTGLPLHVYMHSLWQETVDRAADRVMSRMFERRIFRDAMAIYVPTEAAAAHYRAKHGIEARILPHAVNLEDGPIAGAAMRSGADAGREVSSGHPSGQPAGRARTILFTGGVYSMNRDALQVMARTVEWMKATPGEPDIRLLVCAPNDPGQLARMGIGGARTEVRSVDTATAMRLQREADLLYLPLAFETPWLDEIRTVFPTKAVEYFVSGRPILLHAPADCYTVEDARRFGWALVVDSLDPAALEAGIRRLLSDAPLREKLVAGARVAAECRDATKIAAGLRRDLGLA